MLADQRGKIGQVTEDLRLGAGLGDGGAGTYETDQRGAFLPGESIGQVGCKFSRTNNQRFLALM
ncbi:hypothetical protein A462_16959 [Pseudomonas sp. Ag1]|nr:hypothetical protein A462_16959 [Pseudomonas sp. Ag1]